MTIAPYTPVITGLPEADISTPGVRGWILSSEGRQVIFFDIEPIGTIAEHSHEEQWGIVVEGEVRLTVGGETRTYGRGDSYHIAAGVPHSATFLSRFRAIDVFANPNRYHPKQPDRPCFE
jgi:quercetin dioxygenase-like cupin family protein